uniref:Transposase n=1 Tax=Anisakis simplex TaxID=6269 RepID=A0A0M3JLT3_ANISI
LKRFFCVQTSTSTGLYNNYCSAGACNRCGSKVTAGRFTTVTEPVSLLVGYGRYHRQSVTTAKASLITDQFSMITRPTDGKCPAT